MLFNDVRQQTISSVTLTTGGLSLMVGSLLLSLSAISVYRLNQTQDITINTASWNWMSEVHLRLDAGAEAMGPQLSEAVIPEYVAPAIKTAAHRAVQPKAKWLAKAKSIIRRTQPPIHEPEARAMIITKKSEAKAQAKAKLEIAPASVAITPAPTQVSATELSTLQGLHQQLRGHFVLAMTTQPQMAEVLIAQMGPQAAKPKADVAPAAVEVAPEPLISHHISYHQKKAHRSKVVIESSDEAVVTKNDVEKVETPAPASVSAVTTHNETDSARIANDEVAVNAGPVSNKMSYDLAEGGSQDTIQSTQAAPQLEMTSDYSPQLQANAEAKVEKTAQADDGKILIASGNQTVWIAPAAKKGTVTPAPRVTTQIPAQTAVTVAMAKTSTEGATPSTGHVAAHMTTLNTQRVQAVYKAHAPQDSSSDYSADALNSQHATPSSEVISLTEAFDWVSPISGGAKSYVSKEAGAQNGAWLLSQASDHWPTLARRSAAGIPLISRNTSKLLSTLAGATLEAEAGIVFGKLPSGWTVRLSGRSERPIFLNARNQTVSSGALEGERYFAFLNVAPGAHLVYLANRNGVEEGAVGIAVVGGVATYTDLTAIRKVTVSGRVLDGSDAQSRPMAGTSVRVLGAIATHAETNRAGKFTIENVLTVGDYPVYVETDVSGAYTHRYQLSSNQLQNAVLYRLSPSAIQTWTNQLEGAISPDSGIVIAAVPGVAANASAHSHLNPIVQSLAANPTLKPEVYTLSSSGQMQVGQSLDAQNARFVSVQVPEGPAVAKIIDSDKPTNNNLVWSEVLMISPAVVNIVGPF